MGYAKEEAYEEMISQLITYKSSVTACCSQMKSAATDCVDSTHNDPASTKANEKLSESIGNISKSLNVIDSIINALQKELDDIIESNKEGQRYE